MITDEQRHSYERDGYLVIERAFGDDDVRAMRDEADRIAELVVNVSLATGEASPRLDLQRRGGRVVLRKLQPINDISPVFERVANDERLLGPLRDVLGCEPVLMEEKLVYKQHLRTDPGLPAGDEDEAFPFHTDLAYFWLDGYPRETLSSAIAIDDTTIENGPIRVVPGSHLRDDWPHQDGWPPILVPGAVDESRTVPVLAPAGSITIFHSALVHASSQNLTDQPRRLIILSHHPSTHVIEPDKRNRHLRMPARAQEERYAQLVAAGAASPTFRM